MTSAQYKRHAQLIAAPISLVPGIVYAILAAFIIVFWARFNLLYLNRAPKIEFMKGAAVVIATVISVYAYWVFTPAVEEWLEGLSRTYQGWDYRL